MNPKCVDLIGALDALVPGFRGACLSDDNLFLRGDDDITIHGVWAYCSWWIRGVLGNMPFAQTKALAELVSSCADGADDGLANAALTCFVENLAGEAVADDLLACLTGKAAQFADEWAGTTVSLGRRRSAEDVARAEAAAIATSVLAGTKSPILGARALLGLRRDVGVAENDPDFLSFTAIDSETDHLPIGSERRLWAAAALAEKDVEIRDYERWAMQHRSQAFDNVVRRFAPPS